MRRSLIDILGLPEDFTVILLVVALIIALSPWLAGSDFGILKIPTFSEPARRRLKIAGPLLFLCTIMMYIPAFPLVSNEISQNPENAQDSAVLSEQTVSPEQQIQGDSDKRDTIHGANAQLDGNTASQPIFPDTTHATRFFRVETESDLAASGGALRLIGENGRLTFILQVNASNSEYSTASITLTEQVRLPYLLAATFTLQTGRRVDTVELKGRDVWFLVAPFTREYMFWLKDGLGTPWMRLPVQASGGKYSLALFHDETTVDAFVNGSYVDSFQVPQQPGTGTVAVYTKAPKSGGAVTISDIMVWQFAPSYRRTPHN